MQDTKIRTAVIGAGKMGAIHAKVYSSLPQSELAAIVDTDIDRAGSLAKKYKCSAFSDFSELLGKVDAVTIATPTTAHYELAKLFIENGIAVLIEKPLASDAEQGREIVELAKKRGVVAAVGHSERCNPVVQAIKRLQISPRFIESTRISPYPFRSTDISVVLDVMIHDIDIILSLAASKVEKVDAVGIGVIDPDKEDICNARIVFENGCIANVTASRLALKTERKVRVFSRQAYLSLDYFAKTGTIIKADTDNVELVNKIRQLKDGGMFDLLKTDWTKLVHYEKLQIDDKEPLRLEQESFLKAVADKDLKPEVSAEEGLAALACAEMILDCVKKHKWD
ncbi:MAG: Gfo/Idh/MocA family oxidoreductase [Sedimentisphaerales bacterium]|nr:Gfo/Idh/MocA family oxidoreductase [Sedimentisphaerales bacterium]